MELDASIPQNDEPGEDADLAFALLAMPGCQPGLSGRVIAARSSGLYVSDDGGRQWWSVFQQVGLAEPLPVTCLASFSGPDRQGEVIGGAPGCLIRSSDGGSTWRVVVLPSPPPTVSSLAISPGYAQDSTLFAGTVEDGLFISHDGGRSFFTWNFGLLDLNVMCLAISPQFTRDETVFAGTETGIFRSTNGGRAWREIELPFGFDAVISLALSPDFELFQRGTIYAGTENYGLWASSDGGERWSRLAEQEITDPVNTVMTWPAGAAALTATGLFRSEGPGGAWQNVLPDPGEAREVVAILHPFRPEPGQGTLVSYSDGRIEVLEV